MKKTLLIIMLSFTTLSVAATLSLQQGISVSKDAIIAGTTGAGTASATATTTGTAAAAGTAVATTIAATVAAIATVVAVTATSSHP